MNDQDEMYEAATEEPVTIGCPSLGMKTLPGGFDGVGPAEKDVHGLHGLHGLNTDTNPCKSVKSVDNADAAPDYEMLALQFARNSFDFAKFQDAIAAVASMKQEDFPGVYYKPGWLCELAKKLEAGDVHGLHGLNTEPNPCKSVKSVDEAGSLAELQREEARQLRKIHWRCYETKVDLCVMGKTKQNGKVYEVRIVKRSDSKVQDTYGECKVNGKGVLKCSFTGSAWMLKRILTAGMQALVNYKAKRNRDRRRNYAKRDAAKENGGQA